MTCYRHKPFYEFKNRVAFLPGDLSFDYFKSWQCTNCGENVRPLWFTDTISKCEHKPFFHLKEMARHEGVAFFDDLTTDWTCLKCKEVVHPQWRVHCEDNLDFSGG